MKIRIEKLEIELPNLVENYFASNEEADKAFEGNKSVALGILGKIAENFLSQLCGITPPGGDPIVDPETFRKARQPAGPVSADELYDRATGKLDPEEEVVP